MNALTAQLRAAAWWLIPAILLVLAIGWETDWGAAIHKPMPSPAAVEPKAVDSEVLPEYLIAGGVEARAETVRRTLFNPTRRPAPVSPQDGASARMKRGQFALAGTTIADGKSIALLREIAGNKTRRVQQGDFINGMLVARVEPDRVRLAVDDEWEDLALKVATNPRPTSAPPVAAASAPVAAPAGAAPPVPAQLPALAGQPGAREAAAQTLAERRRAARAAQAAREASTGGAQGAAPAPSATGADGAAGTGAATGTGFDSVFQRYQQRNRGAATK
jgi:hypothetical protein